MHPNTISVQNAVVNAKMDVIFSSSDNDGELGFLTKSTQILNVHGSRIFRKVTVLNYISLYSCFSIDNRQPKHVILSACQMCSQRTWSAWMWGCTNRGRQALWEEPWKINSNFFASSKYLSVSEITKEHNRRDWTCVSESGFCIQPLIPVTIQMGDTVDFYIYCKMSLINVFSHVSLVGTIKYSAWDGWPDTD